MVTCSFFSFVTTDYNLFVSLIFFIIPFNLKTRVARSRDLTWFDTNINLISIHTDSCFCFKVTHTLLSDTYFRSHYFCFVNCAFCWNFSKNYQYFKVEFFQISGIFPIYFGCFLLTNTTEKKLVELQKFYKAISLQYWQFQDNWLVTETCNLWEQDETWNLQNWDSQKWSRDQVSRLHHCK